MTVGLTQKTSQTLIPLCTLRLCGLFFCDPCVSPGLFTLMSSASLNFQP